MRMRWVWMDPPGELCQIEAVWDIVSDARPQRFLEAGCGAGSLARELSRRGLSGAAVDPSPEAIAIARERLRDPLTAGRLELHVGTLETLPVDGTFDLAVSMMTVEHLADDVGFVRAMAAQVRPGGQVVVGAPGRMDRWGVEDEVVGHLRRYERRGIIDLLRAAGLEDVEGRSVAVPVANLLLGIGNRLVARSTSAALRAQSAEQQTLSSGIREVPFKTVFPAVFRLILNRWVMTPWFVLQRLFYKSDLGITVIASGRVPLR